MDQIRIMKSITFTNKVGYSLGDAANNMMFAMVSNFLLFFYTDVFGITAVAAGGIFLISRIWDAVNDPIMGYIADHTDTRWGKFRPYFLWGALPVTGLAALMFSVPELSYGKKLAYAYVTYILYGMAYTFINIPYGSMAAVMTQDTQERSTLAAFRTLGALCATSFVIILTKPLVAKFSTPEVGFQRVMMIFGAAAVFLYILCFLFTKERVKEVRTERFRFREAVRVITTNRPLILLCLTSLCGIIVGTVAQASLLYYVKYNLMREELYPKFMAVFVVSSLIGIILTPLISRHLGKKRTFIIGMVISITGNIGLYFIPYQRLPLITVCFFLIGAGHIIPAVVSWAMEADTVEYAEWKTGHRGTGVIYAAFSFIRKLAQAIGGGICGFILGMVGYVPNAEQSASTLVGIKAMVTLVPISGAFLGMLFILFYPLTENRFKQIMADLDQRARGN